jgi:RNA polymerase sigma factor (TIGR02999 family)
VDPARVTRLLEASRDGDPRALEELLPLVYDELRSLAEAQLRRERRDHTLQPTALVHEAWIRLAGQESAEVRDRGHFLALAAMAMRRILVNHAAGKRAQKRGGDRARSTLFEAASVFEEAPEDLVDLDAALVRLAEIQPEKARIVELRFFAGLSNEETAQALSTSTRTVERGWRFARAWLAKELGAGGAREP